MNNFPTVEYVTHTTDKIEKLGTVKFRTFTFGEHRQFLEAQMLGDQTALFDTVLNILDACTFGKLPLRTTEMYLLDMLYLQIFIKSKGANVPAVYRCSNVVAAKNDAGEPTGEMVECGTKVNVNVPLSNAYLHQPEGYEETSVVRIGENAGLKLRQPTPAEYEKVRDNGGKFDLTDQFLYASVECVFDGERVMYPGSDYDLDGLIKYLGTLPDYVVDQIRAFYDSAPTLRLDFEIKCPTCGHREKIELEGLDDFFG